MRHKKKYGFKPDYAVPPGRTLREIMGSLGMSQKDMAMRAGLTVQSLIRIFKGDQPISYETANRLELVTGVPARYWNNLELQFQEQLSRFAEFKRLQSDLDWLKTIPVRELAERGYLKSGKEKTEVLREVLAFYGVVSVKAWHGVWDAPAVAARRSPCFESQPGPASAWIRQGELQAQKIECKPYDRERFLQVLGDIRGLTRSEPDYFEPEAKRICGEAGVALSLVPEMKKAPWNGATKWLSPQKAMILLCLRGKSEDKFWFSFFHEAGHVLHDSKKDLLINDDSSDDPREERANRFAAEALIPSRYNLQIRVCRSRDEIVRLADRLGIAPGIVVGRYQHLTKRWSFFKNLIRIWRWSG